MDEINICFEMSIQVFSKDWDSKEDEHWDNY